MNSEAEEKAQQENEERRKKDDDGMEETIGDTEKEKLLNENHQLRDKVRAYQQRFGELGEIGDVFERLAIGIQESSDNFVERVREKEREVELLKKENAELVEEREHYKKLNIRGRNKAIILLTENKMLRKTLARYRTVEEDYKDGSNKVEVKEISLQERPVELAGFRNCYYCPVSCVSSVVSFIFSFMGLPVCVRRFEREVQNTINSLSIECGEECIVEDCSLAFKDFYNVSIIEKESKISEQITDVDKIDHHLEKAIETMNGEPHPALFIMHYRSDTGRAGHCLAIMPDLKLLDVQGEFYWYPEKDPHWRSVNKIEVWKVEEQVAEEFEEKCSVRKCGSECIRFAPNPGETANELS